MIKIKSMTVEADGTGGMDFTFDSPEDLARLWALSVYCGPLPPSDDQMQVFNPNDICDPNEPLGKLNNPTTETVNADVEEYLRSQPQTQPPIPPNVYYALGNFYDTRTRQVLGMEFAKTWIDRHAEFPEWRDVTL